MSHVARIYTDLLLRFCQILDFVKKIYTKDAPRQVLCLRRDPAIAATPIFC